MVTLSADTGLKGLIGAFLLSCVFLTTTYHTTFAFDRPVNSLVSACLLAGTTILVLARFAHHVPRPTSYKYSTIPLAERRDGLSRDPSPVSVDQLDEPYGARTRNSHWWAKIAWLTVLGCTRVELYREISLNVECAPGGYSYVIPFLVSLYDYWHNQRFRVVEKAPIDSPSSSGLRTIGTLYKRVAYSLCQCRSRYVLSATFLMAGGVITSWFNLGRQSTYICPSVSGLAPWLHLLKVLSVISDTLILLGAADLAKEARSQGARKQALMSWGCSLLGVAVFWAITGAIIANQTTGVGDNGLVDAQYFRSAFGQCVLITLLVVSASQLIPYLGIVGLSLLAGFVFLYFSWASALYHGQEPYPLITTLQASTSLLALFIGGMLFLCGRAASDDEPKFLLGTNLVSRVSMSILFGIGLILALRQPGLAHLHPIDLLIYDARVRHGNWLSQTTNSKSLKVAVKEYRRRYHQYPPPGFDKWYEFATSRNSVIIDDFDQIHDNLIPFRAIPPAQLREITHDLATNLINDLGGISIRNGTPNVQEDIKPTHRWMVLGAAEMIEKFSKHLPDMDIVFNLNDEPRVAVPWEKLSVLKNEARAQSPPDDNDVMTRWSRDRASGWDPLDPAHQTNNTVFTDCAWSNIFDRYVSAVCPPSSKARSQRIWNKPGICMSCVRPHSLGQFPVNWDIATDICHQPDLETLHGFIISPASFKVSQDLVPVFSQSSVSGFSDIMYPSPWNYVDKVKYEPSTEHPDMDYGEKQNDLFWIGSTSEGVSLHGQWKGMPRQRFSHLINNNTLSKVSVLLPATEPDTYIYTILDGIAPSSQLGLNATVHVADPIIRCGDDCAEQATELGPAGWVPFQAHWAHRYLFDLDGAGFSGRFVPFLQSHSLPFKTGLLRQWFDSRVTAWLHFVPVDIRLHGVWSTLAYFAGVDGLLGSDGAQRKVYMPPHDVQGRWIAEEGRKWAGSVLRKEDMEVYFFRLLLEWARLTDDQRDLLGYVS